MDVETKELKVQPDIFFNQYNRHCWLSFKAYVAVTQLSELVEEFSGSKCSFDTCFAL